MEKKLLDQEVALQDELKDVVSDWSALNENQLAAVGGGCAEATPY